MKRDLRTYLFDILEAGRYIQEFTKDLSLDSYQQNELAKAGVERKFAVIGEALVRLREEFPDALEKISDSEKIVGFRNVLIHGYDIIDDATVWSAIQSSLPTLLREVEDLMHT